MLQLVAYKLIFIGITILAAMVIRRFARKEVRLSPEWWTGNVVALMTFLLSANETIHLVQLLRGGAM